MSDIKIKNITFHHDKTNLQLIIKTPEDENYYYFTYPKAKELRNLLNDYIPSYWEDESEDKGVPE